MKQIALTQGEFAIVDDDSFEFLSQWKWYLVRAGKNLYAGRKSNNGSSLILMHRQIMDFPLEKYVDHIDGYGLNNCRSNLRLATNSENQFNRRTSGRNKSGYRGVNIHKKTGKWEAAIRKNGRRIYLGLFDLPEQASQAYMEKAAEIAGEFLNLSP